jgi:hypothetical protein
MVIVAAGIPLYPLFAIKLHLDLSACCTGGRVLGLAGRFFSSGISFASRSTTHMEGKQPLDITYDF